MRNYVKIAYLEAHMGIMEDPLHPETLTDAGFLVFMGEEPEDAQAIMQKYLDNTNANISPWVMSPVDAEMQRMWVELNKENLVHLCQIIVELGLHGNEAGDIQNFLNNTDKFSNLVGGVIMFVEESPRDTWSHGK